MEEAVRLALERIDAFINGEKVALPSKEHRRAADTLLEEQAPSVRTAALYLMYYWVSDPDWDLNSVPVGTRGTYGDKLLCEELGLRHITLYGSITAYAENLGWKGNVKNVRLEKDPRFNGFLAAVADAKGAPKEVQKIADYFASRFAESKVEPTPLPPVGADVLTFVRAKRLFHALLALESEGHVQQFLVASLLFEYRRRHGLEIRTHHPHASDKFDGTAGDIEEYHEERLVRAYEVTVRDDWRNRVSNFKTKMDRFKLPKYVIIAANVNADPEWSVPATMALKLNKYERDIAVVDITDVLNFLAAELNPAELRAVVNKGYEYLSDRKLCGKEDFKEKYRETVRDWLDEVSGSGTAAT
ncbi:MAG: hypothetical protein J0I06_03980 [Planctomycetes bacterium]|nr:hypothetical protein [Planctomycetota bacterium]